MKISVFNRETLTNPKFKPPEHKHAIISISTPKDTWPTFPWVTKKTVAQIAMKFHDFDPKRWNSPSIGGMNEKQAREMADFAKGMKGLGVEEILVHCDAGISRSAGTAAALSLFFNGNDGNFHKTHVPNIHVKSLILRALGMVPGTGVEDGPQMDFFPGKNQ